MKQQLEKKQTVKQFSKMESFKEDTQCILVGYYLLRGKGQIIRLLCEFIKIPYKDILFNPKTWNQYKEKYQKQSKFLELPFIKDGSQIVSQCLPSILYLIQKQNRMELLGIGLKDQVKVDMLLWTHEILTNIIGCYAHPKFRQKFQKNKEQIWVYHFKDIILSYEKNANNHAWYMGYLTIVDFFIYQLYHYISYIYPSQSQQFLNLNRITNNFKQIPQIKSYECSQRAIKQYCPLQFYQQFKCTQNE